MKKVTLAGGLVVLVLLSTNLANAAPYIVNAPLKEGDIAAAFDNLITGTNSAVFTVPVVYGQSTYEFIDGNGDAATVTVTRPNGASVRPTSTYSSNGIPMSGYAWNISPSAGSGTIPGFDSGITFTFSSPVNAFGFEVGDWATCCMSGTRPANIVDDYGVASQGSGLWIAFDGGAATLPGNALVSADNPGYAAYKSYTNFIGAIDSSGYFTSVTFFGDGFGEYLLVGGTLRFASVPINSIPEPETWAMLLAGLGIVSVVAKRHRHRV